MNNSYYKHLADQLRAVSARCILDPAAEDTLAKAVLVLESVRTLYAVKRHAYSTAVGLDPRVQENIRHAMAHQLADHIEENDYMDFRTSKHIADADGRGVDEFTATLLVLNADALRKA